MNKSYYIRARLLPTLLTCFPILILINAMICAYFENQLLQLKGVLHFAPAIGISGATFFFLTLINRVVAKEIFQRLFFKDELYMPTTNWLLYSSSYFDPAIRKLIRSKIEEKYKITLLNETEEKQSEDRARKLIVTTTSQIRNDLRENKILLQHNIEYGFFRNLMGGSLIAFLFSIGILFFGAFSSNKEMLLAGTVLSLIYFGLLLFGKVSIKKHANYYAKILYEQFLSC